MRARGRENLMHSVSVPPPPGTVSEQRARLFVGSRYPDYVRVGQLVDRNDFSWHNGWKAFMALIEEGHVPRDRRIIERAQELERIEAEQIAAIEETAARRKEKR